jgi:hypothetical protein
MIRMTEIYQGPVVYDEKSKKNVGTHELREVMINPKYVVAMRPAKDLQSESRNKGAPLIPGLHEDTSYTQIMMHCPSRVTALIINVVGSMTQITEKIMLD